MSKELRVFNSLTREKEVFRPLESPFVGLYVCGPTVYNNVHLGNVRTFMSFDVIYRYLRHVGYKVRYVRNLTDVGHLLDSGEDKISKKAKLDNLEPMEVVQLYTNDFHDVMDLFNNLRPDIEPVATGHLLEQLEIIEKLLTKGLAYESNGSVYFDVLKYHQLEGYGQLSGRNIDDLLEQTRALEGGEDKRNPLDFALWKKANPNHIMRWKTRWGEGFPGWHLECSAMSTKYLGQTFDIHGGGMDLKFPHHECEIAQNKGACGEGGARYWLHTNMLTVHGQKMSKSLGNSFLPHELISGDHPLLERGYSPMTVRFFMLQSHYASTLDFSNDALEAARKGFLKMANGMRIAGQMKWPNEVKEEMDAEEVQNILSMCDKCEWAMNDDFNTAMTIGHLFNLLKKINSLYSGGLAHGTIGKATFERMIKTFLDFTEEVLGLKREVRVDGEWVIDVLLKQYAEAKKARKFDTVDDIRSDLKTHGIVIQDMKDKIAWAYDEQ